MSLVIAGLGIKFLSHLTRETEKIIQNSDKVLYLANDRLFPEWILMSNKNSESLEGIYFSQSTRYDSYNAIKEKIISELKKYRNVSFIIYGNPNFLVQITALVEKAARSNGYPVYILPAISSLDCLLADLNINPGDGGMQLFEATELIVYRKMVDITSHVVIFQPAAIGQNGHIRNKDLAIKGVKILSDCLYKFYDGDKQVIFYEASQFPNKKPIIINLPLKDICRGKISSKTTIYLSPSEKGILDKELVKQIKLVFADLDTTSKKSSI